VHVFLPLLYLEPENSHVQYSTTAVSQTSYYKHFYFVVGVLLGHQNILLLISSNTHFQLKFWDRFGYLFFVKRK